MTLLNQYAVIRNGHVLTLQPAFASTSSPSVATAVNDAGDVVGWYAAGPDRGVFPIMWTAGSAMPHQLGSTAPPGTSAITPTGINDAKAVVGNLFRPSVSERPALLTNGAWTPLPIPVQNGASAYATAINNSGVVVGAITDPGQAFVWDGSVHFLAMLPGTSVCSAGHINNAGDVTGSCGSHSSTLAYPFLDHNGTVYPLFSLIASGPVLTNGTDGGINDAGQIVVLGNTAADFHNNVYLFTPVSSAAQRR